MKGIKKLQLARHSITLNEAVQEIIFKFVRYLNTNKLNLSRELKTAFFIIGTILIFFFGFNYLKGSSLLSKEKVVHALYSDVEGLVVGANVTISGMNVGKVRVIDFDENYDKIKVTFMYLFIYNVNWEYVSKYPSNFFILLLEINIIIYLKYIEKLECDKPIVMKWPLYYLDNTEIVISYVLSFFVHLIIAV